MKVIKVSRTSSNAPTGFWYCVTELLLLSSEDAEDGVDEVDGLVH